eukprot:CAMPEP_0168166464 /NCGR_PEP_ID=MMETSP0139_2-20121125/2041_1 /TAXON_ID=44445 /ORGANISM="Pseudo-nitzschia australis, Strain 10249 10 AB" /LENGTH=233 /DNA_ID=CAMNT_0008083663 /DNA_START=40 /DNA_END=741 /DNA_ORIENTATION=+
MVRNTPNHTAMRLLLSFLVLLCHTKESQGFAVPPVVRQYPLYYHAHHVNFDAAAGITTKLYADRSAGDSSGRPPLLSPPTRPLFPVLKRIAGVNWAGSCRFINEDLMPTSLRLRGGIRFDLPDYDEDDVDEDDDNTVKMNSFIVFPNGKSRQIEMRYVRFEQSAMEQFVLYVHPTISQTRSKPQTCRRSLVHSINEKPHSYPIDYKCTGTSLKRIRPRYNRVDSVLLELPYDG